MRSRIAEPLSGGCLPEAAKKCASACGRWRWRVKTTPLTCRVNAKHAFVALNRPLVPYPRCANIHSRAIWQQPMKRDRIWSSHPLGLLLARALGSRGLPLGSGALLAHAVAALSGPLVAVGAASPHGRGCPLFQPSSGTLVVVRSRLPSLLSVRVALPCRCRLLPLQHPIVNSSRHARFPDVFLGC